MLARRLVGSAGCRRPSLFEKNNPTDTHTHAQKRTSSMDAPAHKSRRAEAAAAPHAWARFVCASDAADAFVAYLKFLEGRGQAPPGAVVKAATDLMGVMERSKGAVEAG